MQDKTHETLKNELYLPWKQPSHDDTLAATKKLLKTSSGRMSATRRAARPFPGARPPVRRRRWTSGPALWLLPSIVVLVLISLYPQLYSLVNSFRFYNLGVCRHPLDSSAVDNYLPRLRRHRFPRMRRADVVFAVVATSVEIALGLAIALLLKQRLRGVGLARSLLIMPTAIAPASRDWRSGSCTRRTAGWFRTCLAAIGVDVPPEGILGSPDTALIGVMATDIWQWTPFVALIVLAGLQGVPGELLEAAQIDGAGAVRSLWSIVLPMLKTVIVTVTLLRFISTFNIFDIVFVETRGGPGVSTNVIGLDIFYNGLSYYNIGYASALTWIVTILIAVVINVYLADVQTEGQLMAGFRRFLLYLALVAIVVVFVVPLAWFVLLAFRPADAEPLSVFFTPDLSAFGYVFVSPGIGLSALVSSIIQAVLATAVALPLAIMASYGLTRFRYRGREALSMWYLGMMLAPPVVFVIPLFVVLSQLGIIGGDLALVVAYQTFAVPLRCPPPARVLRGDPHRDRGGGDGRRLHPAADPAAGAAADRPAGLARGRHLRVLLLLEQPDLRGAAHRRRDDPPDRPRVELLRDERHLLELHRRDGDREHAGPDDPLLGLPAAPRRRTDVRGGEGMSPRVTTRSCDEGTPR